MIRTAGPSPTDPRANVASWQTSPVAPGWFAGESHRGARAPRPERFDGVRIAPFRPSGGVRRWSALGAGGRPGAIRARILGGASGEPGHPIAAPAMAGGGIAGQVADEEPGGGPTVVTQGRHEPSIRRTGGRRRRPGRAVKRNGDRAASRRARRGGIRRRDPTVGDIGIGQRSSCIRCMAAMRASALCSRSEGVIFSAPVARRRRVAAAGSPVTRSGSPSSSLGLPALGGGAPPPWRRRLFFPGPRYDACGPDQGAPQSPEWCSHMAINSRGSTGLRSTVTIEGSMANSSPRANRPEPVMTMTRQRGLA